MELLQVKVGGDLSGILIVGTLAMVILTISVILLVVMHQRKVIRYHLHLKKMEAERQQIFLKASIRFQEEERHRIAADLHDDAGPLLATARLYLNENLVNQPKAEQLQSIFSARQIIDDAILLIRNISHSLLPPTLRNFGLESATKDLFQKISGSGIISATARFHDYKNRMVVDKELLVFRIIQELVNNYLKHSQGKFLHLTQNVTKDNLYIRLHHDGKGIVQADYEHLNFMGLGLGLKNIASRVNVLHGKIYFEYDNNSSYYKITIEVPLNE